GTGWWALERKDTGAFIGQVGAFRRDGQTDLELGWVVHRPHWNHGFATEAARAALEHALTTLGEERAISQIAPENAASIRVAERIGQRFEREIDFFGEKYR